MSATRSLEIFTDPLNSVPTHDCEHHTPTRRQGTARTARRAQRSTRPQTTLPQLTSRELSPARGKLARQPAQPSGSQPDCQRGLGGLHLTAPAPLTPYPFPSHPSGPPLADCRQPPAAVPRSDRTFGARSYHAVQSRDYFQSEAAALPTVALNLYVPYSAQLGPDTLHVTLWTISYITLHKLVAST